MAFEEAGDLERVAGMSFHAKREGLQAAAQEVGRESVQHGARVDHPRSRTRDGLGAPREDARGHVVVAVQILRRRLANDVGAELQRAAEKR
jgi:hypothetical protein